MLQIEECNQNTELCRNFEYKISRVPFSLVQLREYGACLSYSEHLQFNREGASAKLPPIDTVTYRKYLAIQKEGTSQEDENARDMQIL